MYLLEYIESDGCTYSSARFVGIFSTKTKLEAAMLEYHEKNFPNKEFQEYDYEVSVVEIDKAYLTDFPPSIPT
jgi:hypothetical protein